MAIQAVSFGATTKNGNEYNKTNSGKIAGAVVGAGYIATTNLICVTKKNKMGYKGFIKTLSLVRDKLVKDGATKADALKKAKLSSKLAIGSAVVMVGVAGLIVGSVVDMLANKKSAKAADAKAEEV